MKVLKGGGLRYSTTYSLTLALDGVGGQRQFPTAVSPGKRPNTHDIGGWVCPRTVWKGAENLAPSTGIRSPDRLARSESLFHGPLCLHITRYQLREISSEFHYCNYLFVILIALLSHVDSVQAPGVQTWVFIISAYYLILGRFIEC